MIPGFKNLYFLHKGKYKSKTVNKIDEAMAIRWHMGEFGDKNSNTISQAYDRYPLAVKLHLADLESTFLREKGTSAVNK